jgi:hypothetical protein
MEEPMDTKDRPTLTVFRDDGTAANVHTLIRRYGTVEAVLYLYLGRAAPQAERCGLFQCHPDYIARDTGLDRQDVLDAIPNLEPHAQFDDSTWVWWVEELAEQYIRAAGNNSNQMKGVKHFIQRIPDCRLRDEAIQFWSEAPKWDESILPLDTHITPRDRNGMEGTVTKGLGKGIGKVNSVVECGGGS